MSDDKAKKSAARFSRFDVTVWLVSFLLLAAIVLVGYIGSPDRAGATIAYLYPAYGGIQNIWMIPVNDPAAALQLTNTPGGVWNFSVSPDGHFIAYAARDPQTTLNDLWLLDLRTRQTQQLTNCVAENTDCRTPEFQIGGKVIAYERQTVNTGVTTGTGAIRIWLLDLTTQPYSTRPLSEDSQLIGHSPQWSADGGTIAFFSADIANPGVLVYNFAPAAGERTLKFIPGSNGSVGTLSPNGKQLVFPDIEQRPDRVASYLKIADLDALQFQRLTPEGEPAEDENARWHPDGQQLAVSRRYLDDRFTQGYQLYLMQASDGSVTPLAFDEKYTHGFFDWNRTGDKLIFQRFALGVADAKPEIWWRDMTNGTIQRLTENAFYPRWVLP
jgi:Tol biopolymer transport system component